MLWKSSLNHHTFHSISAHFLIIRARVVGAVSINTHQPDDVLEAPCDSTPSSDFIYVYYIGEIICIIHHLTNVNKSVFVRISVIPESVENIYIGELAFLGDSPRALFSSIRVASSTQGTIRVIGSAVVNTRAGHMLVDSSFHIEDILDT